MEFNCFSKKFRMTSFTIVWIMAALMIAVPVAAIIIELQTVYLVIAAVSGSAGIWALAKEIFQNPFSGKLRIEKSGITYISKKQNFALSWHDILLIGIANPSAKKQSDMVIISTKDDIRELSRPCDAAKISKDFIFCMHSPELLAEIQKYWHKEIINEKKISD